MKMMLFLPQFLILAILAFNCATSQAIDIRIGDTAAGRIAKDVHISGKGVAGQCLPFARALQKKFEASGIAARVVVYGYEAGGVPLAGANGDVSAQPAGLRDSRGAHAVVVYNDGGRTCVMDNQSWAPGWVRNATPVEMAQQFSGIGYQVRIARVEGRGNSGVGAALPHLAGRQRVQPAVALAAPATKTTGETAVHRARRPLAG